MDIQNNKKHDRMVHRRGSSSILILRILTMGGAETMPSTLDRAMPSRDHDEDGEDGSVVTAAAATAAAVGPWMVGGNPSAVGGHPPGGSPVWRVGMPRVVGGNPLMACPASRQHYCSLITETVGFYGTSTETVQRPSQRPLQRLLVFMG